MTYENKFFLGNLCSNIKPLLGHAKLLQVLVWVSSPTHFCLAPDISQVRVLVCVPPPQEILHELQPFHVLQVPYSRYSVLNLTRYLKLNVLLENMYYLLYVIRLLHLSQISRNIGSFVTSNVWRWTLVMSNYSCLFAI